jgi:hypothetical protein
VAGERVAVASGTASTTLTDPPFFKKVLPDNKPFAIATPFPIAFTEDDHTETIAGVGVALGPPSRRCRR